MILEPKERPERDGAEWTTKPSIYSSAHVYMNLTCKHIKTRILPVQEKGQKELQEVWYKQA